MLAQRGPPFEDFAGTGERDVRPRVKVVTLPRAGTLQG